MKHKNNGEKNSINSNESSIDVMTYQLGYEREIYWPGMLKSQELHCGEF